jgi:peptide/nickel transport system substrate-binding protein
MAYLSFERRSFLALTGASLSAPAFAQSARARTLRFMPQAALAVLDPIFNPTTIVTRSLIGLLSSRSSRGAALTQSV